MKPTQILPCRNKCYCPSRKRQRHYIDNDILIDAVTQIGIKDNTYLDEQEVPGSLTQ